MGNRTAEAGTTIKVELVGVLRRSLPRVVLSTLLVLGFAVSFSAAHAGAASISGTVYEDDPNTPGDDNTTPIEGICVNVAAFSAPSFGSATTDASGGYVVEGLDEGVEYGIQFSDCDGDAGSSEPPAIGASEKDYVGEYYDNQQEQWAADRVTAGATGINASLSEAASISGTVYEDDPNTPEDDETTPIEGICVNASSMSSSYGSAITDATGSYTVTGLEPGVDHTIQFTDCDGGLGGGPMVSASDKSYASEYYDDQQNQWEADSVTASATGINASLGESASISGTVYEDDPNTPEDDEVTPIEGICVNASDASFSSFSSGPTSASGEYSIEGLQPGGDYNVRFTDCGAGFRASGKSYASEYYDNQQQQSQADPVTAPATDVNASLVEAASISGTVYEDDPNTPDDDESTPIEGICVNASDTSDSSSGSATTNAGGEYTIDGLQPGVDHAVRFADCDADGGFGGPAPPAVGASEKAYLDEYYDNKQSQGDADPVESGATDVDASLLEGGSISGTVHEDDPDTAEDDTGTPIQGICVSATPADDYDWTHVGFATTAGDGTYTIDGLRPGDHVVQFNDCNADGGSGAPPPAVGASEKAYIDEYYDNQPRLEDADPVDVAAGTPTSDVNASLLEGGSISGAVHEDDPNTPADDTTTPIEGICVGAYEGEGDLGGSSTVTAADGSYTIDGLRPGADHVVVFTDCNGGYEGGAGISATSKSYLTEYYDNQQDPEMANPVPVGQADSPVENINASLLEGGKISGTVYEDDLATEGDDTDTPLQGICVQAYATGGVVGDGFGSAETDASGVYTIEGLPTGSYAVEFTDCSSSGGAPGPFAAPSASAGDKGYVSEYFDNQGNRADATTVDVTAPGSTGGIDASLAEGATIGGTVTDASTSDPIPGICVRLEESDPAGSFPNPFSGTGAVTNENGEYRFEGRPAGSYHVVFVDCDFFPSPGAADTAYAGEYYDGQGLKENASDIEVELAEKRLDIDADLEEGGSISGVVTEDGTGDQLGGICVTAAPANGGPSSPLGRSTTTGENGSYTVDGLRAGDHKVTFNGCGGAGHGREYFSDEETFSTADPVPVALGQDTGETNGSLGEGSSIFGAVTEEGTGTPLGGVCVFTYDADGDLTNGLNVTGEDGTYRIFGVGTGDYRVEFMPNCFAVLFGGGGEAEHESEFHLNKPNLETANVIEVDTPGSEKQIDAELTPVDGGGGGGGDTTPPDTVIDDGPEDGSTIGTDSPEFAFSGVPVEDTDHFECKVDDGGFSNCESPLQLGPLADGEHTLRVKAVDAAGNEDLTPEVVTFTVDTTGPSLSIDDGPDGSTNDATPTFDFTAEDGATLECAIDAATVAVVGPSYGPCDSDTSHAAAESLADGDYTFSVRATDSVENETTRTRDFTVDTVAPTLSIDDGPNGPTSNPTPTFDFTAEDGATLECAIDPDAEAVGGPTYGDCDSSSSHTAAEALADGGYTFSVRATDEADNRTTETRDFTVDATPPSLTIDEGPSGPTKDTTPEFIFTGEDGATLECAIELDVSTVAEESFGDCDSGTTHAAATELADGTYTFAVRATDAVGNQTTEERQFRVDTVAPQTTLVSGPAGETKKKGPRFALGSSEANSTFKCKLDGEATFTSCNSPKSYSNLADGEHTFSVKATDPAGNEDGDAAARTWTINSAATTETTQGTAPPQGTVESDPGVEEPDEETPVLTGVKTPSGGDVTIVKSQEVTQTPPEGYEVLGQEIEITAPDATVEEPLELRFVIDSSVIPPGTDASLVTVFRNGEPAGDCDGSGQANPDPCIAERNLLAGGDLELIALTSHASAWNPGVAPDTTPPDTSIDAGPANGSTIDDPTPEFRFSGSPGSDVDHLECRVDGGSFGICTSPKTLAKLSDGQHTFRVRAVDAAGNADQSPASRTFTVDTTVDEPADPPAEDPSPEEGPPLPPPEDPLPPEADDPTDCELAQALVRKAEKKHRKAKKKVKKAKKKVKKAKKKVKKAKKRGSAKKVKKAKKKVKKAKKKVKKAKKKVKKAKKKVKKAKQDEGELC